jgi:hypothetical protein
VISPRNCKIFNAYPAGQCADARLFRASAQSATSTGETARIRAERIGSALGLRRVKRSFGPTALAAAGRSGWPAGTGTVRGHDGPSTARNTMPEYCGDTQALQLAAL